MGKIISLVNQKGGVGKTTTSINLAASLGYYGKKVLLVDLDPQGNTTTGIGINKGKITYNLYDVLIGACNIKDSIIVTKFKNLSVLPASINLSSLEADLRDKSDIIGLRGEQLKHNLREVKDDYDYIIVDCPPTLSILITNALTASDSVIIPVQCEFLALEGIVQLIKTIRIAQKNYNPTLDVEGVLLTMLDSRTKLGFEVIDEIKKYFKEKVYNTIIPRLVKLTEAPSHGKPIIDYEFDSRGSQAYLNLAKEVIERNESRN